MRRCTIQCHRTNRVTRWLHGGWMDGTNQQQDATSGPKLPIKFHHYYDCLLLLLLFLLLIQFHSSVEFLLLKEMAPTRLRLHKTDSCSKWLPSSVICIPLIPFLPVMILILILILIVRFLLLLFTLSQLGTTSFTCTYTCTAAWAAMPLTTK